MEWHLYFAKNDSLDIVVASILHGPFHIYRFKSMEIKILAIRLNEWHQLNVTFESIERIKKSAAFSFTHI